MKKLILFYLFIVTMPLSRLSAEDVVWSIGKADKSAAEFALAPDGFKKFLEKDFGWEDRYFMIGKSEVGQEFPYVIPGPVDTWGGTWATSGWRINFVNVLFASKEQPTGDYKLVVELSDYAKKFLPLIKISINGQEFKKQLAAEGYDVSKQKHPTYTEATVDEAALTGTAASATPIKLEIPIEAGVLHKGGNQVTITVLEGSWVKFDNVRLEGPELTLIQPQQAFVKRVVAADYQFGEGSKAVQPLLVSVEHITGKPRVQVNVDGKEVFSEVVEKGGYIFEAPMKAVTKNKKSKYSVLIDGVEVESGEVVRSKQAQQTAADYIDTRYGTGHSRWMIAPGPWMPFSMVKMSPDNQNDGWQAGYNPAYESVGTFSHIHEWTLGGLGIFASNGELKTKIGDELKPGSGYRSAIDKRTEKAPIGFYEVMLKDYGIKAEVSGTTRCGYLRFTFPEDRDNARVLVDLRIPSEYGYQLKEVKLNKVSDYRLEGYAHQFSPGVWSYDADQDYKLHFVVEFDQPMSSCGTWVNDEVNQNASTIDAKDIKLAGAFVQFDAKKTPVVQVRTGISLVSLENAAENLATEVEKPFGWSYDAVCQNQRDVWNDIFERVKITTPNRLDKERFYSCMYRSVASRNIWSDVDGQWVGADGKTQQLKGKDDVALGCDAFWNTFWNLNQFWNLVTPEWSNRWVNSQLAMYDAYGWLSKGPAGMNYVPVMVGEHEIPMMVGAYQMGINGFDVNKVLEASVKMQTTPAQKVFNGFAGNRDLKTYMEHGYVPSDKGRFSNTMEYSYDDWCVGQLAKKLGKNDIYKTFNDRGYWWKNAMNSEGYAQMKLANGNWVENFDPFKSGANQHYVEANAWQMSFFVPQDVPAMVDVIGSQKFIDRLEWGFKQSDIWRYNGMNDQYWDYPVVQGNQQSMHFAFLFNWAGKPWSTQKWTRSILDRYYGYGVWNAYLGDEDQGQMSAWLVMATMGLFQTDGGCSTEPIYEIASPLFERVEIDLGGRYGRGQKFVIEAKGASRDNMYVQGAMLNGKPLNSFKFSASELLKGGSLVLEMGATPNEKWGVE